jgi:hypothetical protein
MEFNEVEDYSIEIRDMNTSAEELQLAQDILNDAAEHGLQAEVFLWAVKHMQWQPKISVAEAMVAGYDEWVK